VIYDDPRTQKIYRQMQECGMWIGSLACHLTHCSNPCFVSFLSFFFFVVRAAVDS